MPWLAVTFSGLEGKAKVTTPSGVTVEVFEINTNNTLVTVSAEELKEVNSELPDAFENGVYTIAIGDKEWKIEYKAQ